MDSPTIDPTSPVAPFEQLRTHVASQVADGRLPAGSKLPTVRSLAAELGVAVNTVARAYRELEADGVVVTEGRRGTFVRSSVVDGTSDAPATDRTHGTDAAAAARTAAEEFVRTVRRLGLTGAEATRLVEQAWHDR
jgi:DNA-binding transcriptional regulator YhcF (GntR family)